MVLPTYLNIKEAAKRIQQKCRESVTPEWLLQHASEGKLRLFALLRKDACILKPGIKIDFTTLRTLSTSDQARLKFEKIHEAAPTVIKAGSYVILSENLARKMLIGSCVSSLSVTYKRKKLPAVDRDYVYVHEGNGNICALPGFSINMSDLRFLTDEIERLIDANQPAAATHPKVSPGDTVDEDDSEARLADLFDPVTVPILEKMFQAGGKWEKWAERAKRNGLDKCRTGRGRFNPYLAAEWFLHQGVPGWDKARCRRTLANNLPDRSLDSKNLLIGETD